MDCPICKEKTRVEGTAKINGKVIRLRRCTECSAKFYSEEIAYVTGRMDLQLDYCSFRNGTNARSREKWKARMEGK